MYADELFSIDAAAELRALGEERLQGGWEVPAELVRFVLARGARSVVVKLARRSLYLRASGSLVSRRDLELLAAAVAVDGDGELRHRALVELEEREIDALLFIAALHGKTSSLQCDRPEATLLLNLPAAEIDELAAGTEEAIEIRVRGARYDHLRAVDWLHDACRFVTAPVVVNGERVRQEFPEGMFRMRISVPLPAYVAISSDGHTPTLHLLRHGVVAARANVPGYPAFHAAVEMSGTVRHGASAAELRDAVRPHLGGLIDAAVELMVRIVPRFPALAPEARRRVASLLLESAARRLRVRELCGMSLIEAVDEGGSLSFLSVDDLTTAARRIGGPLPVLSPGDDPGRYAVGPAAVPVIDAAQRAKLREIADLHFRSPIAVQSADRSRRPWRGWLAEVWRGVRSRLPAVRFRVVEAAELSAGEAKLLNVLTSSGIRFEDGREASWELCDSRRRFSRGRHGTIRLGRHHPLVKRVVAVVREDPRALFPGVLALDLPSDLSLQPLRSAWAGTIVDAKAACPGTASESRSGLG